MLRLVKNLLTDENNNMSKERLKKEILKHVNEMEEALKIQMSSTKLLDYCVHDMLSLA